MRAIMIVTGAMALTLAAAVTHAADGEEVYRSGSMPPCSSCHDTGAAGAPKVGDAASWGDSIDADVATLVQSVKDGKGIMPAYEGKNSEEELTAAVNWMLEQSKE